MRSGLNGNDGIEKYEKIYTRYIFFFQLENLCRDRRIKKLFKYSKLLVFHALCTLYHSSNVHINMNIQEEFFFYFIFFKYVYRN